MKARIAVAAAKAVVILGAVAAFDETDIVASIAKKAIEVIGKALSLFA